MDDSHIASYFRYWGKAKKDPASGGADYHLLPYHCLDVAAVGWFLLDPNNKFCKRLAQSLGVAPEWLQTWFSYCLVLHDLGKFFRSFQNLSPDMSDELVPSFGRCIYEVRHDTLGYALWPALAKSVEDQIPKSHAKAVQPWMNIVCGHHGKPPEKLRAYRSYLHDEDELAAEEFVRAVNKLWLPELAPLLSIDSDRFKCCSWQLAGLAVLADWLGSNQTYFSYCAQATPLEEYWRNKALPAAQNAIGDAHVIPRNVSNFESITQQFDFIKEPTPLQAYAQDIDLAEGPQLFILEDVTGAGKTEAAIVLVHRLMSQGLASGLYVGLPTMATANGMYKRMAQSYRKLFAGGELPSLVLAHGASQLSKEFIETVYLCNQAEDKSYEQDELSASAYCNHWLADSRKKALLADVGVGTIDQALLGILPAKHQSLRLLGLAGKVLVVDEVHAFDPYMQELLCALLSAHAVQGGSVILLSATLPLGFRQKLSNAYAKGLSSSGPALSTNASYPWVTQLGGGIFKESPVDTRGSVARRVEAKRVESESAALTVVIEAVKRGECVCWIRNTVKDAGTAMTLVQQSGLVPSENITLFHSRYAMVDRQAIEQDVLQRFGKNSRPAQRAGQVLIATQVVEQSLDLDFDVMLTDLAPIDLLIQRAGRLQRHTRSKSGEPQAQEDRDKPCLHIVSPDPRRVESENWLRELLPGTQAVYPNVGQLWLTLNVLFTNKGFAMPQDGRRLIEGVYGQAAQEGIPELLEAATMQAQAQNKSEAGMGAFNVLKLDKGYFGKNALHNGGWADEVNIPTRLGGDTVTCVLVTNTDGRWQPYAKCKDHPWALSQISLPRKEFEQVKKLIPSRIQKELDELKEKISALKWLEIIPLVEGVARCYSADAGWKIES